MSTLDVRAVLEARDVAAAMHELAVRTMGSLTGADLEAMREANRRFQAAIDQGDMKEALRADDDLLGVPVAVAANRALTAVLDQFTPVLRRAGRLRFSSPDGRASVARHDELIRLCATAGRRRGRGARLRHLPQPASRRDMTTAPSGFPTPLMLRSGLTQPAR